MKYSQHCHSRNKKGSNNKNWEQVFNSKYPIHRRGKATAQWPGELHPSLNNCSHLTLYNTLPCRILVQLPRVKRRKYPFKVYETQKFLDETRPRKNFFVTD